MQRRYRKRKVKEYNILDLLDKYDDIHPNITNLYNGWSVVLKDKNTSENINLINEIFVKQFMEKNYFSYYWCFPNYNSEMTEEENFTNASNSFHFEWYSFLINNENTIRNLYATLNNAYEPLENYDRKEEGVITDSHHKGSILTEELTGNDKENISGIDKTDNKMTNERNDTNNKTLFSSTKSGGTITDKNNNKEINTLNSTETQTGTDTVTTTGSENSTKDDTTQTSNNYGSKDTHTNLTNGIENSETSRSEFTADQTDGLNYRPIEKNYTSKTYADNSYENKKSGVDTSTVTYHSAEEKQESNKNVDTKDLTTGLNSLENKSSNVENINIRNLTDTQEENETITLGSSETMKNENNFSTSRENEKNYSNTKNSIWSDFSDSVFDKDERSFTNYRIHGNIGVTTNAQMGIGEIDFRKQNEMLKTIVGFFIISHCLYISNYEYEEGVEYYEF